MFKLPHKKLPLISHASKVMLKILQSKLQEHVNYELPNVQMLFFSVDKYLQLFYTSKIIPN